MFAAAAVCSTVLILSTLMSLAGTVSSSGGFSFFAVLCILQLAAQIYLTAVLFRRKKGVRLGLPLGANALISLLTVCFFFSWQELFICMTWVLLTVSCLTEPLPGGKQNRFLLLAVSLSAACILALTVTGMIRTIGRAENGPAVFDPGRWAYFFLPFVFALLNAAQADLIAGISCGRTGRSGHRVFLLLPAFLLILAAPVTFGAALAGLPVGGKPENLSEFLLIGSGAAAYLAAAVFPFLYVFLPSGGQNERAGKEME